MELIFRFFSVSRMSSARTDVVLSQIERQALGHDETLLGLAGAGRTAAQHVADIETRYRLQTEARGAGDAAAVDKRMDVAVGGFFDGLTDEIAYARSVGENDRADRLQRIVDRHFEGQVSTITRAPYEEELQRVERLHADIIENHAEDILAAGLQRWVQRIESNLGGYRDALSARSRVTRGDLDSARRAMHVATCAVVGHICSQYVGAPDLLEKLLTPLVDQQDRIAAIMRARRQGVATGAMDEDLIEGDGAVDAPPADAAEPPADAAEAAGLSLIHI